MAEFEGISFTITGETESAVQNINKLSKALSALSKIKVPDLGLGSLSQQIVSFSAAVDSIDTAKIDAFRKCLTGIKGMGSLFGRIGKDPDKYVEGYETLAQCLEQLSQIDFSNLSEVSALSKNLNGIKGVGALFGKIGEDPNKYARGYETLTLYLEQMSQIDFSNLQTAAQSIRDIASAAKQISGSNLSKSTSESAKSANSFAAALARVKPALAAVASIAGKVGNVGKKLGNVLIWPFKQAVQPIMSTVKGLKTMFNSLSRIAMYRLFRAIIKAVTQSLQEGTKNLYLWSKALGGTFASQMDRAASSMVYFKNSVAAAWSPLMNVLGPALDAIVDKVVAAINAINQLIAILSGASGWTRATRKANEYENAVSGAGGAAKEALKYIAPFDELNVMPDDKHGGGGGSSAADEWQNAFENLTTFEEGIADFASKVKEAFESADWQGLGQLLGGKVNEIIDGLDFAGAGAKVGSAINSWFTTKYWTLDTVNFENIGAKIGEFLNNALGNINFEYIGRGLVQKFTKLGDMIIGACGEINWKQVGTSIRDFLIGAMDEITKWLNGKDWGDIGRKIVIGIKTFFEGLTSENENGNDISSAFAAMLRAAFDAGVSLVGGMWDELFDDAWFANLFSAIEVNGKKYRSGSDYFLIEILGMPTQEQERTFIDDAVEWLTGAVNDVVNETVRFFTGGLSFEDIVQALEDSWPLVEGWFADLPAKLKNFGIRAINALKQEIFGGINQTIEEFNNTPFAQFFDIQIEPIKFDLLPEIPEEELNANYNAAKAALEAKSAANPVVLSSDLAADANAEYNDIKRRLEELSSGRPIALSYSVSEGLVQTVNGGERPVIQVTAAVADVEKDANGRVRTSFNTPSMTVYGAIDHITDNAPQSDKTFNITGNWANWGYGKDGTKTKSWWTTWDTTANWSNWQVYGTKNTNQNGWTTWNSTANFTKKVLDTSKGLQKDGDNLKIDATANITKATGRVNLNVNDVMQAKGGVFSSGFWKSLPQYAGGTSRAHGSLFLAGEAGPEVVGHVGGRTEVLNRSQIASSIYAAVVSAMSSVQFRMSVPESDESISEDAIYRAFRRALDETDFGGDVELDGQKLYTAMVDRNRKNTRMTGVNAFASA